MKRVAIIGAGAAGLMAAQVLAQAGVQVSVYDKMPSPARKFLLAGRGGLNLTHSEPFEKFVTIYGEAGEFLRPALQSFTPQDLRDWAQDLGEETFVGSSGRVFPVSFKASPLLRLWLRKLTALGVTFKFNFNWQGELLENTMLLAMGGGSWKRMGSDGSFVHILQEMGVQVNPLKPSNMGFVAEWSSHFSERFQGTPLKNCGFSFGETQVKGEAMVTALGVEGGAIYALSAVLREAIMTQGEAVLNIDMKPDLTPLQLQDKWEKASGSTSNRLRKIGLSPAQIGLLNEHEDKLNIIHKIKCLPVKLKAYNEIDKAISSAGGVALYELNSNLSLKKYPHIFCAGEMLDFEAPTGGYLLQAAFSTGAWAAHGVVRKLQMAKAEA